jgi:type I restriction enzyme, S subunit
VSVPRLRFPGFVGEWEEKRLGELFPQVRNGFVGTATPFYDDNGVAYLQGKNIKAGAIDPKGLVRVTNDFHHKQKKSQLKTGDLLMVQSGHAGECAVVTEDFEGGNCHALVVMSPNKKVAPEFIRDLFYAESGQRQIYKIKTGNTIEHVLTSDLKPLRLDVPTLPEQKRIAGFLGVVDAKIATLRARVLGLQTYKRGLMQALFSQSLRFTKPDGTAFPDWEEKRLGEVFAEIKDRVGDIELPTYSISAGRGFISQEERFGKDISGQQNERYTALKVGDFSYNKGNSISYKFGCIYENTTGMTIAVPNVFISFRLRNKKMSSAFFGKLFEDHHLDKGLRTLISSGARMNGLLNVNKESFFKLKIPVPHPDEQAKIAAALQAMDAKIAAVQLQVDRMQDFKKGLLQQMFV